MTSRQQEYGEIIEALAKRTFACKPERIADDTDLKYDIVKMACEELTLTGYMLDKGGKFSVNMKNPHLAPIVGYAKKTDQRKQIPGMLAEFFTAKDSPILKEVEAALEEAIHMEGLEEKELPELEEPVEPDPIPPVEEVPEPVEEVPIPEEEQVEEPTLEKPEIDEETLSEEQEPSPEEPKKKSSWFNPAETLKKKIQARKKELLEKNIEELTQKPEKEEKKKDSLESIGEDIKIFIGSNVTGKLWREGAEDILLRFVIFEELTVHGITYNTPDDLRLNISTFTDHELEVILTKLEEYFED